MIATRRCNHTAKDHQNQVLGIWTSLRASLLAECGCSFRRETGHCYKIPLFMKHLTGQQAVSRALPSKISDLHVIRRRCDAFMIYSHFYVLYDKERKICVSFVDWKWEKFVTTSNDEEILSCFFFFFWCGKFQARMQLWWREIPRQILSYNRVLVVNKHRAEVFPKHKDRNRRHPVERTQTPVQKVQSKKDFHPRPVYVRDWKPGRRHRMEWIIITRPAGQLKIKIGKLLTLLYWKVNHRIISG